jgi:hypothetical protein
MRPQPKPLTRRGVARRNALEHLLHPIAPMRAGAAIDARVAHTTPPRGSMSKMAESRLALKRHVIVERESEEDDLVLIDSRTGRMSACNETASVLVAELQSGATIGRLVKALSTRFAVAPEVATRDVNALLDSLAAEGLLESAD